MAVPKMAAVQTHFLIGYTTRRPQLRGKMGATSPPSNYNLISNTTRAKNKNNNNTETQKK
jgi:hypothetical protein